MKTSLEWIKQIDPIQTIPNLNKFDPIQSNIWGNVFNCRGDNGGFSQEQLDMYKECFKLMDVNKDGVLDKSDLRAAFDNVGKLMDESELDGMLGEVGGACNFDNMVKMFQEKMAGGKHFT